MSSKVLQRIQEIIKERIEYLKVLKSHLNSDKPLDENFESLIRNIYILSEELLQLRKALK